MTETVETGEYVLFAVGLNGETAPIEAVGSGVESPTVLEGDEIDNNIVNWLSTPSDELQIEDLDPGLYVWEGESKWFKDEENQENNEVELTGHVRMASINDIAHLVTLG